MSKTSPNDSWVDCGSPFNLVELIEIEVDSKILRESKGVILWEL